jgi:hypothetical protein
VDRFFGGELRSYEQSGKGCSKWRGTHIIELGVSGVLHT